MPAACTKNVRVDLTAAPARSFRAILAYRSVVARLACPARTRTVVSGPSARIHSTIAVARRSCNRSPGQPNRRPAGATAPSSGSSSDRAGRPAGPATPVQQVADRWSSGPGSAPARPRSGPDGPDEISESAVRRRRRPGGSSPRPWSGRLADLKRRQLTGAKTEERSQADVIAVTPAHLVARGGQRSTSLTVNVGVTRSTPGVPARRQTSGSPRGHPA